MRTHSHKHKFILEAAVSGCVQIERLERRVAQLDRECVRQRRCEQLGVAHAEGARWTHPNDSCLECSCQVRTSHSPSFFSLSLFLIHTHTHALSLFLSLSDSTYPPEARNKTFVSVLVHVIASRSQTSNANSQDGHVRCSERSCPFVSASECSTHNASLQEDRCGCRRCFGTFSVNAVATVELSA